MEINLINRNGITPKPNPAFVELCKKACNYGKGETIGTITQAFMEFQETVKDTAIEVAFYRGVPTIHIRYSEFNGSIITTHNFQDRTTGASAYYPEIYCFIHDLDNIDFPL